MVDKSQSRGRSDDQTTEKGSIVSGPDRIEGFKKAAFSPFNAGGERELGSLHEANP
jgi:hypothetical protein